MNNKPLISTLIANAKAEMGLALQNNKMQKENLLREKNCNFD